MKGHISMAFKHKIIAAGLTATLIGAAPLSLGSTRIAQAAPADDLASVSAQLDSLGVELADYQSQLADMTSSLETTDYQIGQKQAEIKQTQDDLSTKRSQLSDNMRSSYKTGPQTSLDFILGSTSPEDLASRIYYLDKVSDQQAADISAVQQTQEQLNQEMEELEDQQSAQQSQVDDMQAKVSEYQSRISQTTDLYNSLDAEAKAQISAEANSNVSAAVAAVDTNQQALEATGGEAGTGGSSQESSTNNNADNGGGSSQQPSQPSRPSRPSSGGGSTTPAGGGLATALAQVGKPYVWGASGPNSFDCSGLVCYSYGYARGRDTYSMISSIQNSGGWKSSQSQLEVGDLVFEYGGSHVGIYVGNGQIVHAPQPGSNVQIGSIYSFYGGGSY